MAFDPDGDRLSLHAVGESLEGALIRRDYNSLAYVPPADFTGIDLFEVEISDPRGATTTGTIVISVFHPFPGLDLPPFQRVTLLEKMNLEWTLVSTSDNLKRLVNLGMRIKPARNGHRADSHAGSGSLRSSNRQRTPGIIQNSPPKGTGPFPRTSIGSQSESTAEKPVKCAHKPPMAIFILGTRHR